MIEKKIKSVIPVYGMGILFTAISFAAAPYNLFNLLLISAISFAGYLILNIIFPGETVLEKAPPAPTGDKEIDQMIMKGRETLDTLENIKSALADSKIEVPLNSIIIYSNKIFDFSERNIARAYEVKSFIDYYLPTTVKLAKDYAMLKKEGIEGENIDQSLSKIENVMGFLQEAYRNKLDDLYEDKALDIITDVKVMKKLLESEGLLDSTMDINASRKAGGSDA